MKLTDATWIFLDTETTGLKPEEGARVIELGWVTVRAMKIVSSQDIMINPGVPLTPEITRITHITDADLRDQPGFEDAAKKFFPEFSKADFVMAYNKDFDRKMLDAEFQKIGAVLPDKVWMDPLTWSRAFAQAPDNKLASIAKQFNVSLERAHRADADAAASAEIAIKFFEWGVDEANFPDDVDELKAQERDWRKTVNTKSRLAKMATKNTTGTPGQMAQNVYDHYMRERLMKIGGRGRWGK